MDHHGEKYKSCFLARADSGVFGRVQGEEVCKARTTWRVPSEVSACVEVGFCATSLLLGLGGGAEGAIRVKLGNMGNLETFRYTVKSTNCIQLLFSVMRVTWLAHSCLGLREQNLFRYGPYLLRRLIWAPYVPFLNQ